MDIRRGGGKGPATDAAGPRKRRGDGRESADGAELTLCFVKLL